MSDSSPSRPAPAMSRFVPLIASGCAVLLLTAAVTLPTSSHDAGPPLDPPPADEAVTAYSTTSADRTGATDRAASAVLSSGAIRMAADDGAGEAAACVETTDAATRRIRGVDRWDTAACVARVTFADGVDVAVLARGEDEGGWADALAGTVLATALDAPILLTARDALPETTAAAIRDLGVTRVVVLGGTGAISQAVVTAVEAEGAAVERIAGTNRAETAVAIARAAEVATTADDSFDEVFVVNSTRPADALVAGSVAARRGAALLVTRRDVVPEATADAITGTRRLTIIGGTGVISDATEQTLRALAPEAVVTRVAGSTRHATATALAGMHPSPGTRHVVASADGNLVDAIAAGWAAARDGGGAVLYALADGLAETTRRTLVLEHFGADDEVVLLGGTAALGAGVEEALASARSAAVAPELRGIWVHLLDDTLKTRDGLSTFLDDAVEANMNTVIVQGVRRHDAFYPSDVLPQTSDPRRPDYDLLEEVVSGAHARGLEVHVWFSVMPSSHPNMQGEGVDPSHIGVAHGADSDDSWVTTGPTHGYEYMDPGIPGVQDHVAAMLREVVERYDVDAVHLDYLRYATTTSGHHPTNVARYEAHGDGRSFNDWRRQQTEDIARRVYLEVAEADPTVLVSMAGIAQGSGPSGDDLAASWRTKSAFADKFQDWSGWMEAGVIDMVFPMTYFREPQHGDWFDQWADWTREVADREDEAVIAMGLGAWLNPVSASLHQLDQAREVGDGAVVYSYQGDNSGSQGLLLDELARSRWTSAAPAPEVARKATPTQGHVLVEAADGDVVTLTSMDGSVEHTMRGDATGHVGFVWLDPGAWIVRNVTTEATSTVDVRVGEVTRVPLR